ncbi:hypothetical protein PG985_003926 [Apiospora marii]|uniref:Uncharacterized protein n=1 Tax=Apiospora marii TaxID=335849 RepID=A0ABR1SGV3_9PEZI
MTFRSMTLDAATDFCFGTSLARRPRRARDPGPAAGGYGRHAAASPPLPRGDPPNDLRGASRVPRKRDRVCSQRAQGPSTPVLVSYSAKGAAAHPLGLDPSVLQLSKPTQLRRDQPRPLHGEPLRSALEPSPTRYMIPPPPRRVSKVHDYNGKRVTAFARGIGPRSAGLIRHISLAFLDPPHFDLDGRIQEDMARGRTRRDLLGPEYPNLENVDLCLFKHLYFDGDNWGKYLAFTRHQTPGDAVAEECPVDTYSYKQMIDQRWKVTSSCNPHHNDGEVDGNEDDRSVAWPIRTSTIDIWSLIW